MAAQKKVYQEAESFAQKHSDDEYGVALNWFKVADQLAGTEYSVKALARAREAQERFAKKSGALKAEKLPDTPAMALVNDGDNYLAQSKFDEAILCYQDSLKKEITAVASRKLAHAYFNYAQKLKDKLIPQFEAADVEYRAALAAATQTRRTMGGGAYKRTNWNDPTLQAVIKKVKDLQAQAKESLDAYSKAASYFTSVLNLMPNKHDLDAAGHYALCYSVKRGDPGARSDAKRFLLQFLNDYKPANDLERTLYEFCRSELLQLNKPAKK